MQEADQIRRYSHSSAHLTGLIRCGVFPQRELLPRSAQGKDEHLREDAHHLIRNAAAHIVDGIIEPIEIFFLMPGKSQLHANE